MDAAWFPKGAPVPVLSPNDHPKPSQRQQKGFGKSQIFNNFQEPQKGLKKSNSGAFGGPAASMRVLMGARVPVLSAHDHPNPSQRRQKGFGKSPIFENFGPMHTNLKRTQSSLARAIGRPTGGTPCLDPRPCHWLEGSCISKKLFRTWSESTHSGHNTQTPPPPPPPPPPPKNWHPGGGCEGQIRKFHWRIILSPKMIPQFVSQKIYTICLSK